MYESTPSEAFSNCCHILCVEYCVMCVPCGCNGVSVFAGVIIIFIPQRLECVCCGCFLYVWRFTGVGETSMANCSILAGSNPDAIQPMLIQWCRLWTFRCVLQLQIQPNHLPISLACFSVLQQ
eukprot:PhF_6_TR31131/c0_g1_i1/m.45575